MNFNHLPLTTEDGTQLNLDALYKIAPSCFTEARDEKTGALRHVVDFKKLRQLLGDNAVEDEPEAYEFTWVGKNAARREAAMPINKTLRPVPESSVDWDHTQNIYIEGDNLDALKLLQKSYLGKVKMIYIDPPYNTGNDFVYHDDFHRTQAEEDLEAGNVDELGNRFVKNTETNGKFHSDWCSMIYPRLQLAHTLLSEDGVIFISIDDNEEDDLKKICDEIFGAYNFLAVLVWEKKYTVANDARYFSCNHDYILVYAKDISNFKIGELPRTAEMNSAYNNPDNHPKGPWKATPLHARSGSSTSSYTFKNGVTFTPPTGTYNRYSPETLKAMDDNNEIWFGIDGNSVPSRKTFLCDLKKKGIVPRTLISFQEGGHNHEADEEVKELMEKKVFTSPKPTKLIKLLMTIANLKDDSLVLDFFSGSGTTADALMQINAKEKSHRKYILIQLPENIEENSEAYKAGYKNICEIGEERIRRAGKKIKEDLKSKQPDLFTNGNDDKQILDTGFRVFRIDSSNMKDVYFAPKDLDPKELNLFADNVKEDRTELDLLYGCMVDWGLQLSLPLATETIDGVVVYTVNDGDLVACFGKPITENVVKAMADKAPLRVLFRDSCFEKDEQKINIFEQFKQLLGWSDDEALNNIRVI